VSGELSLGLARGFRQRNDQRRVEAKQDEALTYARDRQAKADAIRDEQVAYERSQRPAKEAAVTASTNASKALEDERRQKIAQAAAEARQEGLYDLMDELDKGSDPAAALANYNRRGTHKIDPASFKFDRATGNVAFTDDDGTPQQGNVRQLKQVIDDALTPSSEARKPTKLGDREAIIGRDGKVIAKGPLYGKEKESGAVIKGKSGEWYRDPVTKKWAQIPGAPGKGGPATTASGAKVGTWSRQAAQKSVREIIAQRVGLKYDPQTEQITGGKPGATESWLEMSAKGDEILDQVTDSMGPAQIAHMVTDAYGSVLPPADYEKDALKNTQRMRENDPSQPDSWYTTAEPEDRYQARVKQNAKAARDAAMASAEQTLQKNLQPFLDAIRPAVAEDASEEEGEAAPDDETAEGENPEDVAPAVERGGAEAAAPGSTPATGGARAHYPVTVDRLDGDADVPTQQALRIVKSNPTILRLLQTQVGPGKAAIVKFPDGNQYYLAGTTLKRVGASGAPAKGK